MTAFSCCAFVPLQSACSARLLLPLRAPALLSFKPHRSTEEGFRKASRAPVTPALRPQREGTSLKAVLKIRFQQTVELRCWRLYSPSQYQAFCLPESEQNPGPVVSRLGDEDKVRWASPAGDACIRHHVRGPALTRDASRSCSICRSFLLFSSSRRRSFVLIRSTSLFCMFND